MERDKRGRFTGSVPDPKIMRMIAEDQAKAERYIKALAGIGMEPRLAGLKRFEETGYWHIGYETRPMMEGLLIGFAHGISKKVSEEEGFKVLANFLVALDMKLPEDLKAAA